MTQRTVFVIAECCSAWRFGDDHTHLANAYRMIVAAKECGADAAKFQWCSDPVLMSQRRNDNNPANYEILNYPFDWLVKLKTRCDEVGIEFMVTAFIEKDIEKIAPLVKRFKVASAESSDESFVSAHLKYEKEIIASYGFGAFPNTYQYSGSNLILRIHCVVSYPTPIDQINLAVLYLGGFEWPVDHSTLMFDGLSDHTTSTLTGALAVAAGADIIEKHVRLWNTPADNPDRPHSLPFGGDCESCHKGGSFEDYVDNIRQAELAMGSGENVMMDCEKANTGRRVKA